MQMDYAETDLVLAIAHHLLIFLLAGVLAFEVAVIRPELTAAQIQRLSRVDIWYGILAGLILAVGFSRVTFAAKGWDYYAHNYFFWAKLGTFALVGLLSVVPTLRILRWRRNIAANPSALPSTGEISTVQRFLWLEVIGLGFVLAFAASMARGYGTFS
jgi:putative membrane protein